MHYTHINQTINLTTTHYGVFHIILTACTVDNLLLPVVAPKNKESTYCHQGMAVETDSPDLSHLFVFVTEKP